VRGQKGEEISTNNKNKKYNAPKKKTRPEQKEFLSKNTAYRLEDFFYAFEPRDPGRGYRESIKGKQK